MKCYKENLEGIQVLIIYLKRKVNAANNDFVEFAKGGCL